MRLRIEALAPRQECPQRGLLLKLRHCTHKTRKVTQALSVPTMANAGDPSTGKWVRKRIAIGGAMGRLATRANPATRPRNKTTAHRGRKVWKTHAAPLASAPRRRAQAPTSTCMLCEPGIVVHPPLPTDLSESGSSSIRSGTNLFFSCGVLRLVAGRLRLFGSPPSPK